MLVRYTTPPYLLDCRFLDRPFPEFRPLYVGNVESQLLHTKRQLSSSQLSELPSTWSNTKFISTPNQVLRPHIWHFQSYNSVNKRLWRHDLLPVLLVGVKLPDLRTVSFHPWYWNSWKQNMSQNVEFKSGWGKTLSHCLHQRQILGLYRLGYFLLFVDTEQLREQNLGLFVSAPQFSHFTNHPDRSRTCISWIKSPVC